MQPVPLLLEVCAVKLAVTIQVPVTVTVVLGEVALAIEQSTSSDEAHEEKLKPAFACAQMPAGPPGELTETWQLGPPRPMQPKHLTTPCIVVESLV